MDLIQTNWISNDPAVIWILFYNAEHKYGTLFEAFIEHTQLTISDTKLVGVIC